MGPNQVWAYDFVFDACANDQPLKCPVVTEKGTHEVLAIDQGNLRSRRVIEVLSRLVSLRGAPRYLRSDNGPGFVSRPFLAWLRQAGIENTPTDHESINTEGLWNWLEARAIIETWRRHYNEDRPHSSLGYRHPNSSKVSYRSNTLYQPTEPPSTNRWPEKSRQTTTVEIFCVQETKSPQCYCGLSLQFLNLLDVFGGVDARRTDVRSRSSPCKFPLVISALRPL